MFGIFVKEFSENPIATSAAGISIIVTLAGWALSLRRPNKNTPSKLETEEKSSIDHVRVFEDGLLSALAVLIVIPVGFAEMATYWLKNNTLSGVFAVFVSFGIALITVSVFTGRLLKDWIETNALVHLPAKKNGRPFAHIADVEVTQFCKRVGFAISCTCVLLYWLMLIEDFHRLLIQSTGSVAGADEAVGFSYYISIASSGLVGGGFGGILAGYLFKIYSGVSKYPLVLKKMADEAQNTK